MLSRHLIAAAFVTVVGVLPATVGADAGMGAPVVNVSERDGVYSVIATFDVSQAPAIVLSVLTDYERIPHFMPGINSTIVRERTADGAVIEQEATSRFMWFSKRVHLLLDIVEGVESLRFRDRCGKSFTRYEGRWMVSSSAGRTHVAYQLTADPSFDVPEFVLKRLLKRDSNEMIEHLRREIAARNAQPALAPR